MQLHVFEKLNLNAKACIAWREGIHIAYRSEGNHYMALYRLNDFYVEIQYHTCHDGIAGIESFACEECLQPYLDQIDLSELLS